MPRSNGKFPKYEKVDIDPEVWPSKYWDSSRVCPSCNIHWPNLDLFEMSPCCDVQTEVDDTAPDVRWPDAVKAFLAGQFNNLYERYNEGRTDQELVFEEVKEEVKATKDFDFDAIEETLTH